MPEVIPIGADHAGFELKRRLVEELRALGYEPLDLGTTGPASTDYPDYAHQVASRVEHHEAAAGCCSAAPDWECRTRPTAIPGFAPR